MGRVGTACGLLLPRPSQRSPPPPSASSSLACSRASPSPTVGFLRGYCSGFRAEYLRRRRRLPSLRAIHHPTGHGRGNESVAAVASGEDKGTAASAAAAAAVFACRSSPVRRPPHPWPAPVELGLVAPARMRVEAVGLPRRPWGRGLKWRWNGGLVGRLVRARAGGWVRVGPQQVKGG